MFAYFTPYKKIIRQLIIGLIISSVIQLAFPFLMQSTIDYGVNFQNINFIQLILVAQLVLFLSDMSVQLLRGWLLMHMTSRIRIRLLTHFLAKLMSLSIGFFDTKNVGDIAGKLRIGQKAIIKLDNFPFAEFGIIEGTVKHISSIPKLNQYAVEIGFSNKLITNTGTAITAKNDIQGTVDIVTEDLRLIERVFYQIRKVFL